jgi:NAD-dependent dihydropyrimidine dehydrogenase PreA subunit
MPEPPEEVETINNELVFLCQVSTGWGLTRHEGRGTQDLRLVEGGDMYYAVNLKEDRCDGCGLCISFCPEVTAIKLIKLNGTTKAIEICELRCKRCGLCVEICSKDALEVVLR